MQGGEGATYLLCADENVYEPAESGTFSGQHVVKWIMGTQFLAYSSGELCMNACTGQVSNG